MLQQIKRNISIITPFAKYGTEYLKRPSGKKKGLSLSSEIWDS
jgi:hypothetical protein